MSKFKVLGFWSEGEQNTKKEVIKTEGYKVFYKDQKDYAIDITCGYGAFVLGYNNKEILNRINENYNVAFLRGNINETCQQEEELAELITSKGNWKAVSWAVSGSDAVEAAMAMVDQYYELKEGTHRKKVIIFDPCYVGTTMWGKHVRKAYNYWGRIISLQSPLWKTYDQQSIEEEKTLTHLRTVLNNDKDNEIGSLLMEASPWLADMIPWSKNFWKEIRKICDEYNILWVLDDVAVCWGKFGTWYSWQNFEVQPDISAIGKALSGGYSPLGAAVCNEKVYDILSANSWDHGHTWQPNMYGVTSSIEVSKYIEKNNLFSKVKENNNRLVDMAKKLGCNYRGEYSMVCLDVDAKITPQDLWNHGLSTGIPDQSKVAKGQIKIVSPLIADEEFFVSLETRIEKLLKNKKLL